MKRRYAVVWEKETLFGKMVDIFKYTADSKEEAETIGLLSARKLQYCKYLSFRIYENNFTHNRITVEL